MIWIFILFFPKFGFSDFDGNVAASVRSLPVGAGLSSSLGYGQLIWGEKETSKDFLYGYIRPEIEFTSAILVNRSQFSVSFFPISLAGITVGRWQSQRRTRMRTVDCDNASCQTDLVANFFSAKLIAGYKSFFSVFIFRKSFIQADEKTTAFAEEGSALVGQYGGDALATSVVASGFKIDEKNSVGVILTKQEMALSQQNNDNVLLFGQTKYENFTIRIGAGAYQSSSYRRGPTFFGQLEWSPLPTLEL